MLSTPLTDRQQEVFELIRTLIHDRGYGPTVREIGEHFGIRSPNGVMCHLRALERKGLITRKANKSRAIELAGIHARSKNAMPMRGILSDQHAKLIPNDEVQEYIDVAGQLATSDRFLVRFSGDSQRKHGLRDGDYLVVDPDSRPSNGNLVVVAFAIDRVAIRSWREVNEGRNPGKIMLESETTQAISYSAEVELIGTVTGLVRELVPAEPTRLATV